MDTYIVRLTMKLAGQLSPLALALTLCTATHPLRAQTPDAQTKPAPAVPEWAQPGSATHVQVAPPADFHRPSQNFDTPIGIFEGQSDIGSALVADSASYDAGTKQYTINSAGYNVWYTRDEFRYLWRKMSGDDSKEAITALHGLGMIHLAQRPEKGVRVKDIEYRIGGRGLPGGATPDSLVTVVARRIGIEKHGDSFALFVSLDGEPMHQFGPPINLHIDGPFYVGIGFCSHLPDKSDTAVLSNVLLENSAGKVR